MGAGAFESVRVELSFFPFFNCFATFFVRMMVLLPNAAGGTDAATIIANRP